jgi:hypothetical protein
MRSPVPRQPLHRDNGLTKRLGVVVRAVVQDPVPVASSVREGTSSSPSARVDIPRRGCLAVACRDSCTRRAAPGAHVAHRLETQRQPGARRVDRQHEHLAPRRAAVTATAAIDVFRRHPSRRTRRPHAAEQRLERSRRRRSSGHPSSWPSASATMCDATVIARRGRARAGEVDPSQSGQCADRLLRSDTAAWLRRAPRPRPPAPPETSIAGQA